MTFGQLHLLEGILKICRTVRRHLNEVVILRILRLVGWTMPVSIVVGFAVSRVHAENWPDLSDGGMLEIEVAKTTELQDQSVVVVAGIMIGIYVEERHSLYRSLNHLSPPFARLCAPKPPQQSNGQK